MKKYILETDGGSRGNPGPSAIGFVIKDEHEETLTTHSETIEHTTNNQAEYQALLEGVRTLASRVGNHQSETTVHIRTDSELLQKQLLGFYDTNHAELKLLQDQIHNILSSFHDWNLQHVPRSENKQADRLVNKALDNDAHKKEQSSPGQKNDFPSPSSEAPFFTLYAHGVGGSSKRSAGWAYFLMDPDGEELFRQVDSCEENSSNSATYLAISQGLDTLLQILSSPDNPYWNDESEEIEAGVKIHVKNELIQKQLTGEYDTNNSQLQRLKEQVLDKVNTLTSYAIERDDGEKMTELRRLARKGEEY